MNAVLFHKDKGRAGAKQGEKWQEGAQKKKKKMSESQVVHYMLCCNTGICAPTDLVLLSALALKPPDSSWTDTVPAVSLCEIQD